MHSPLDGIKVVDLTSNISGPTVTMILGDLGANIIKVERPVTGDDAREMGPLWEGEGVYHLQINRNKRSIVIDLKTDEGKELLYTFLKDADIFVENFRQGKAESLGFGYDKLKAINPQLIYCSLSAYGQNGPYSHKSGYDAIVQAETGIMSINGTEEGESARAPVSILDQGSAMWSVIGILSALFQKKTTGLGQKVETSLFETGLFWTGYHLLSNMATGVEPLKMGASHAAFSPYGVFKTASEEMMIGISNDTLFHKLCEAIDRTDLITNSRFSSNIDRVQNRSELTDVLQETLKQKNANYWIEKIDAKGVPCSVIQKISSLENHPQVKSTRMLTEVEHPTIHPLKLTRLPISLSEASIKINKTAPPLGEDTIAILKEHGYSASVTDDLIHRGIISVVNKEERPNG